MIRIQNIKLPLNYSHKDLIRRCEKMLHRKDLPEVRILRRSLDARRKDQIHYHVTAGVSGFSEIIERKIVQNVNNNNIMLTNDPEYHFPVERAEAFPEKMRPVVAGTGPAGYFAGLMLARAGLRPILLERGKAVEDRKRDVEHFWETGDLNPESNVSFGEGGAGTFSDGKLYTGNKDKDGAQAFVLDSFHRFGAPEEITYDAKPHIGTDVLYTVMQNMRHEIEDLGGIILFSHQLTGVDVLSQEEMDDIVSGDESGKTLYKLTIKKLCKQKTSNQSFFVSAEEGDAFVLTTPALILAIGHSARDTFRLLSGKGFSMEKKPFAVGLRIEHPRELIDRDCYGDAALTGDLPAADYKLTYHSSEGRAVFSFCMCPGGYVVNASTEKDGMVVNGMSYSGRRGPNSNSALVVSVLPEDIPGEDPLSGVRYQQELERNFYQLGEGAIPVQRYEDFCANSPSEGTSEFLPAMKGEYHFTNLRPGLPDVLSRAIIEAIPSFDRKLPGFSSPDALLSGIESRTSSPVRILRGENGQALHFPGIYPCGEGAGYAGGIMSAAVDGIHIAEAVAKYLTNGETNERERKSEE